VKAGGSTSTLTSAVVLLAAAVLLTLSPCAAQEGVSFPEAQTALTPFYVTRGQTDLAHKLSSPSALAVAPSGNVYVFDAGNSRIVKLDRAGRFLLEFGGPDGGPGQVRSGGINNAIAIDGDENIYVADPVSPRVQIFNAGGQFVRSFRAPSAIDSIAVNSRGEVLLSLTESRPAPLIYVFSGTGKYLRSLGERLVNLPGALAMAVNRARIAIDAKDNIFVAFHSWPVIRKYSDAGALLAESTFKLPVALDEAQKQIYSLDFISQHPNYPAPMPLLTLSISADSEGGCYVLFNGNGIIKVSDSGAVVKQNKLRPPQKSTFLIGVSNAPRLRGAYLLDYRAANVYKMPAMRD
jgi:hypothetical protein